MFLLTAVTAVNGERAVNVGVTRVYSVTREIIARMRLRVRVRARESGYLPASFCVVLSMRMVGVSRHLQ